MPADVAPFIAAMTAKKQAGIDAALLATDQYCWHVLGRAQEMAPKDTGDLSNSDTPKNGERASTIDSGGMITCTFGFTVSYAAAVHERLTSTLGNPIRHDPPGQAKFLEAAIRELQDGYAPYVGNAVKAVVE